MLSNGVKVVFEKCGCSHEVKLTMRISCMYMYMPLGLCFEYNEQMFYFQLLKSLMALLNKLIEVPKPYYKLSQFSQHE